MKKKPITILDEESPDHPAPGKHPSTRIMKENIWEIRLYIPDAELTRFISEIQNMMDFRCKDNLIEVSSPPSCRCWRT